MDAVVLFYRMARLTCVPLPSSARDVEAAELDGLAAGALPDEPVVPDAAAEVQAEFLAAVLVDVPRVRDAAELSVLVPDEPVALVAEERDDFPDEPAAPDDSLAFERARDVAPSFDSQAPAELAAIRAAAIVAEPVCFRERA